MGVVVNKVFFDVTREELEEGYVSLKIAQLIGTIIPFFFMWRMIPTNKEAHDI